MKTALLTLALILLTACSSYVPPRQYEVQREKVINRSYDEVWTRIISVFANYGIPIKTIDKASGLIATDHNLSADGLAAIMDCGTPAKGLDVFQFENPIANFNIQVIKESEAQTKVRITTFYKVMYVRYSNHNGNWVRTGAQQLNCNSTGNFEKAIFQEIDY